MDIGDVTGVPQNRVDACTLETVSVGKTGKSIAIIIVNLSLLLLFLLLLMLSFYCCCSFHCAYLFIYFIYYYHRVLCYYRDQTKVPEVKGASWVGRLGINVKSLWDLVTLLCFSFSRSFFHIEETLCRDVSSVKKSSEGGKRKKLATRKHEQGQRKG